MTNLNKEHKKLYTKRELKAWKKISEARDLLMDELDDNPTACSTNIKSIVRLLKDVEWMFEDPIMDHDAKKYERNCRRNSNGQEQ